MGNHIQNSENISLSRNLNFESLYNQIPDFKRSDEKIKKYDMQMQRQIAFLNAYSKQKQKKENQRLLKIKMSDSL
ncbi:hypothetical protein [Bacteroidetes bacterium endosymbiont of Geopemphigus sp.]|uniref:hypothetical protein n=1 Tax=Bacteroidetes bacterium endosymbiont of Geopemphigus sp. TaxID=2047937 RepID=UPI000CD0B6C8|nr:hypothetical protein [Bacteroidetes bacterium endosymbiont of Geopemphigus sp.]